MNESTSRDVQSTHQLLHVLEILCPRGRIIIILKVDIRDTVYEIFLLCGECRQELLDAVCLKGKWDPTRF